MRGKILLLAGLLLVLLFGAVLALPSLRTPGQRQAAPASEDDARRGSADKPASEESPGWSPLPEITSTGFLNVDQKVGYVGPDKCGQCHVAEYESWLETMHSRALDDIDVEREPPDSEFTDEASGRSYRVYRRDGQLRHEESIQLPDGERMVLADHAMRYVIGSGAYSRSYLLEQDGFLTESPVTWYSQREKWDVSPGYDNDPDHPGFARPANYQCLACHVGRVEPRDGSLHRLMIHEQRIDCERCHGPGALHVARHSAANGTVPEGPDLTIVHPARLSREQKESVCFQCHLTNDADVDLRGRFVTDFQPGELLSDYRHGFTIDAPDKEMTVVGHGQQMQLSRCYQESETMTCTTCHNPHRPVEAAERAAYYRQKCLDCHAVDSCGLPEPTRLERQADDNCVTCHMPVTDTDIPHFAFTHHRVGIHSGASAAATEPVVSDDVPPVVASDDESGLSALDRQRNRGLALLSISEGTAPKPHRLAYHREAIRLLEDVAAQGVHDPAFDTALARILWRRDLPRTIRLARRALEAEPRDPMLRRDAASVLAEAYLGSGNLAEARQTLRQLVEVRRAADDWMKLGFCELQLGEPQEAVRALKKAIEIEPHRADLHGFLAQTYQRLGYREQAQSHARRAQLLAEVRERAAGAAAPLE